MSQHLYQDSRHELEELVESTLARSGYFGGCQLRAELCADGVLLTGVVRSYYHKQMAQESVRAITGPRAIRNEIEVISHDSRIPQLT